MLGSTGVIETPVRVRTESMASPEAALKVAVIIGSPSLTPLARPVALTVDPGSAVQVTELVMS